MIREGKRVVGVNARDLESGKKIAIKAGATIMCAGIWSDELHEKFELTPGYHVTMSKGVHIVLPGSAIKSDAGIILKTAVSVLFLIPWGDKWIVGTTDTPYDGDRAEPYASREDVQYILDQANRVLEPKLKMSLASMRDCARSLQIRKTRQQQSFHASTQLIAVHQVLSVSLVASTRPIGLWVKM